MSTAQNIALLPIPWWKRKMVHYLSLIIFSFLIYANTLGHDYTLDDAIVIYDNEFTKKGIKGIPKLLKHDSFRGFFKKDGKDKLVSGGRYRPLTSVSFAIEYQLFGARPIVGHIINLISYILLILIIYNLLSLLLSAIKFSDSNCLAWIISILFALHPVHTEVVANIKGRDEIWALGFGLLAFFYLAKNLSLKNSLKTSIVTGIAIFLALLSKENAISFALLIPLGLYIFYNKGIVEIFKLTLGINIGIALYLILRFSILGIDLSTSTPMELMNNPFLKFMGDHYQPMNWNEKLGAIFISLGTYLKLLFWPNPLTHDYYPRYFDIITLTNPKSLISFFAYIIIVIWGLISFKKRSVHAFSIAFFILPLLLVSNLIFPIGTNMGERFIFFSSLGWAMILGWIFYHFIKQKKYLGSTVLIIVLIGFSYVAIARNMVWKNDYTLFTTDVNISYKSAKAQNSAAGAISTKASSIKDKKIRKALYQRAVQHSEKAIKIHPLYSNAYLIQGICYFGLEKYENAITAFEKVLELSPNNEDAKQNLFLSYREAGKFYGEKKGDITKALSFLERAHQLNSTDIELWRLMGIATGTSGNPQQAIQWFEKILSSNPKDAQSHLNLSISYELLSDTLKAGLHFREAIKLDPGILDIE